MQDTAEVVGQPIRRVFSPFFMHARTPSPFDAQRSYRSVVEDPLYWLYLRWRLVCWHALDRLPAAGAHRIYLLYSFVTLLTLLVLTAMNIYAFFAQLLGFVVALVLAPLLTG